MPPSQWPNFAVPARRWRRRIGGLHRQYEAGRYAKLPLEFTHDAGAFRRIVDLGIAWIDVVGPVPLPEHPPHRILISRDDVVATDAEASRNALRKALRLLCGRDEVAPFGRDQGLVVPDREPVFAPIQREGPARQGLARIPFALAEMEKPVWRETVAQPADKVVGADALCRSQRLGVPFSRLVVVDRNECRLAT